MDKCKKCNCTDLEIRPNNKLYGLYCTECGAWSRWLRKEEYPTTVQDTVQDTVQVTVQDDCYYCDKEYVIPIAWEGGISGWDNIDAKFCPMCGKPREGA